MILRCFLQCDLYIHQENYQLRVTLSNCILFTKSSTFSHRGWQSILFTEDISCCCHLLQMLLHQMIFFFLQNWVSKQHFSLILQINKSPIKQRHVTNETHAARWEKKSHLKYMEHMQMLCSSVLLMNRAKDRWLERGFAKESNSNIPMYSIISPCHTNQICHWNEIISLKRKK